MDITKDAIYLIEELGKIFKTMPNAIEEADLRIKEIEDELEDIRHIIEFINLNASEGSEMCQRQKNLYRERRDLLNSSGKMKDLLNSCKKKRDLSGVSALVRETEERFRSRKCAMTAYKLKVRKDFKNRFNSRMKYGQLIVKGEDF